MSKFGGGGGSSSTTQTSTNNTEVFVDTAVTVDTEALAIAVAYVGDLVSKTGEDTKALMGKLAEAQIVTQLLDAKSRIDQNTLLKNTLKTTVAGAAAYYIWKEFYK
jgi:hypothetical protein